MIYQAIKWVGNYCVKHGIAPIINFKHKINANLSNSPFHLPTLVLDNENAMIVNKHTAPEDLASLFETHTLLLVYF